MHEFEHKVEGDLRLVIGYDEFAEAPDWDFQGTIVTLDRWDRADVAHAGQHNHTFSISYLWERWADVDLIERYLRIFEGVVGFDWFDTHDAKYICIVTEDDLKAWGHESLAEYQRITEQDNPATGVLEAWRAWVLGEVYYYDVQERVIREIVVKNMDGLALRAERDEDWESIESCSGLYGLDWAEEAGMEVLVNYQEHPPTPKEVTPA